MTTIDESGGVVPLFDEVTLFIGAGFEALGVATIVVGTVIAAARTPWLASCNLLKVDYALWLQKSAEPH